MTWSWGTCRSLSLSGREKIPVSDSGGRRDGEPAQDSPANPLGFGQERAHSPHHICGERERERK